MSTVIQGAPGDRVQVQKTLLSAVTATNTGTWFRVQKQRPISFTIEGAFEATVKIFVSNSESTPDDASLDYPSYAQFTEPTWVVIDSSIEWIKAAVTDYTSGAITSCVILG